MSVTAPIDDVDPLSRPAIRVLFADDSAAIRTLARHTLSTSRGFSIVAEATDGAAALSLFQTHQPDCVVLDVEMPGVGGFEALAELHRRYPDVPVVMLSGFSDPTVAERATAAGAAAYLQKGAGLGNLAATIKRVMSTPGENAPGSGHDEVADLSAARRAHLPAVEQRTDQVAADLRRLEYVVSHDMAEPARIMSGFATLLQGRYASELDGQGQLFLEHIVAGAARLQSMIDDLLGYSRAGHLQPRSEVVDMNECLTAVRSKLARRIGERGAVVVSDPLPNAVGDPDLLRTVLGHLVDNAIKFNRSVEPTVRISGHRAGDTAVFVVRDNGIGVAPAYRDEVFDLFRRLNTQEEFPGTGTGLALCRRLVQLQNGSLQLDSEVGTGTTVTLRLPLNHVRGVIS